MLCLAKFPLSNKEHSSVSLLSKYQILFWFLKFHVRCNWFVCIFDGVLMGASSFSQDTKMYIWGYLCCLIYRKQAEVFALYANEPPHSLSWLPLHNRSINLSILAHQANFWISLTFQNKYLKNFWILALSVHICLSKCHMIIYCPQNVLKQKVSDDFYGIWKSITWIYVSGFQKMIPFSKIICLRRSKDRL